MAFITSIKLSLVPLPPKNKAVICAHFKSLEDALTANIVALDYSPDAVELMDDQILDLTEKNILQRKNRFFLKGRPKAILIIEFARKTRKEILDIADKLTRHLRNAKLGYHFPIILGQEDISKIWDLRRSALGARSNMPGDAKPVSVIEDTADPPRVLPKYVAELKKILKKLDLN